MARGKSGDGPNKMQLVRDALDALGPKAKPLEIQAKVLELGGIEISTAMISSYKSMIMKGSGNKSEGRKAGRPAGSKAGAAGSADIASIADDIILIRKLINRLGAKQVNELVDVLK